MRERTKRLGTELPQAPLQISLVLQAEQLLVPSGMNCHLEWWETAPGVTEFLGPLAQHRTLVLYDRHGCGLSDRDRIDFTSEDDMRDIEAVVQALGASEIDLLGVSWGAAPALTYAARHPARVHRLVIYGAGGGTSFDPQPQTVERDKPMAALRRAMNVRVLDRNIEQ